MSKHKDHKAMKLEREVEHLSFTYLHFMGALPSLHITRINKYLQLRIKNKHKEGQRNLF